MVHEMIHYYIAWNRIKDNNAHGKEFMKIANELKEKYGLNITKKVDASSFKLTENAPKIVKKKNLFSFLFD
jgi:predicted SprT family Zn-dependent metalloprotease